MVENNYSTGITKKKNLKLFSHIFDIKQLQVYYKKLVDRLNYTYNMMKSSNFVYGELYFCIFVGT